MANNQTVKIRYFVWLGYLIPIFLSVVSAFGVWMQSNAVRTESQHLNRSIVVSGLMGKFAFNVQTVSRATRGYLLDPSEVSVKSFKDSETIVNGLFLELEEAIINTDQLAILKELEKNTTELIAINEDLINTAKQQGAAIAIQKWKAEDARTQAETIQSLLTNFQDREEKLTEENAKALEQALTQLTYMVWSLTISSAVLALLFGWWVIGWITNRLNQTISSLAASSNEIVTTVEEQERIASQQAASVNETSTTMEELGISSRQSSEQAQAAAQATQQVLRLAESGRQTVSETIGGMDSLRSKVQAIAEEIVRLNEQTNQIGNISQLVSDLANQTNMLALNAAVEAVRAGEHGKGFSVVASEIRKLADQSRQSAGQISSLVGNIQNAIQSTVSVTEEGTQTVEANITITQRTAEAFVGVTSAINEVVENNQQISLNIQQQASAIQQVVVAMTNLNQGAKEGAIGIGQTRQSTQILNDATRELQNLF